MERSRILIVDDIVDNVFLMKDILTSDGYGIIEAFDGEEALSKVQKCNPDLVILDVMMPKLNGYEVCSKLKENPKTRLIPIIIITALRELEDKIKGIEAGADDFLNKPFNTVELRARVKSLLRMKRLNDELDNAENVIFALANAIEAKDRYTEGHTSRVSCYALAVAESAGLSESEKEALRKGGVLHDIGKIGVEDTILNKTSSLTEEELGEVKKHPVLGEKICRPLRSVQDALPVIRWHHEKLDGSGYPDGLKSDQIPLVARVMTIVDVYDALATTRSYKPALPKEICFDILRGDCMKGWWDRDLTEIFIEILEGGELNLETYRNGSFRLPSILGNVQDTDYLAAILKDGSDIHPFDDHL